MAHNQRHTQKNTACSDISTASREQWKEIVPSLQGDYDGKTRQQEAMESEQFETGKAKDRVKYQWL